MTRAQLHGALRLLRRCAVELVLLAASLCTAALLARLGERSLALAVAAIGLACTGFGLAWMSRTGALLLALRCPRLDALGLRTDTRALPWSALRAADEALRTLAEDGAAFRDFFPDARRDLASAAARALHAHRLLARSEAALAKAPPGEAERALSQQRMCAERELHELTACLRELRSRLVASTVPLPGAADALPALQALARRTDALREATSTLAVEDAARARAAQREGAR